MATDTNTTKTVGLLVEFPSWTRFIGTSISSERANC